ncbi:MAG TPA: rRNA maturation RNase YbeY [Puia sp.]|nr:rRNA maturation RNase YbeY [Puia sp.]
MTISPTIRFHFLKKVELRDRSRLKAAVVSLFRAERRKLGEIRYIFCSDKYLLDINRRFLGHDYYTDIITFPLSEPSQPVVAEVYISVDRVRDNAARFHNPLKTELLRVIFHGALHLCGYGDKTAREQVKMRALEDKYVLLFQRSMWNTRPK